MDAGTYPNNVKRMRERLRPGLSQRKFASKIGINPTTLSAIEKGKISLSEKWLRLIVAELGCSADDLLSDTVSQAKFAEEAVPYVPNPDSRLAKIPLSDNEFPYKMKGSHLDDLNIADGDILIVSVSAEAVKNLKTGDVVVVQVYHGDSASTVVRQFVHPRLLITNSRQNNLPIINTSNTDCAVKGLVVAIHRDRI